VYGRLDIVVNNAGVNVGGGDRRQPIDRFHREDWDRIIAVDLTGVCVPSSPYLHSVVFVELHTATIANAAASLSAQSSPFFHPDSNDTHTTKNLLFLHDAAEKHCRFVVSKALIPLMEKDLATAPPSSSLEDRMDFAASAPVKRIVNISSVVGVVPFRLQSAYVAAKAGLINLTKSMALELGPRGCETLTPLFLCRVLKQNLNC
jgi:NAD(P)-dependent dehydrogenase (short-subunit alcohol dehydrogenase family)